DERIAQLEKQIEQISKERDELHNGLLNDESAVLRSDFAILRLGEVLDNISGGVVLCEMTKGFPIVYVSRGFTTLTGYTLEDLYHAEHSKIIADPSKNVFGTIINEKKDSEDIFTFEYKMLRKDKTTFWVMDNAQIIIARDKKQYVQSIISDITHYKDVEQALRISQKSYELAMAFSDITLFEYDVQTKRITTQTSDFEEFGMPAVIEGGMEGIVKLKIIAQRSKQDFKEFYNRIDRGDASSQCTICVNDLSGSERILQLQLINIFDDDARPIRAVGMRKDVTEAMHLKHEKDFGDAITSELLFAFEANVTHDKVVRYNSEWAKNLHINPPTGYKELMKLVCDEIYPEYAENISYIFSEKAIIDAFKKGRRILKAEFKYSKGKNKDLWLETGINIIKDGFSGDISIRVYTTNINSRKVKEQKAIRESKHYELMISKSATVYEVNITRNSIAFGTQNWEKMFGIKTTPNYSEMVASFALKATYPEDSEGFTRRFSLDNVLNAYADGKTEICHEYRRPDEDGKFIWVRCTMHLFEDPVSNELRGFAYVENINTEKEKELELVYKSTHDLLTGFYNKSYVEEKINEFLTSAEGKHGSHIFYIIDIDYFKHFNDAFGHAFGDAVLSQTAAKISMLFRDDDIMGRIGGDEFVVLMKNVQSERKRESKALEICNNVREVYSKRGEDYDMSVSIGAAIYSSHGTTYDELYRHSDAALYDAKQKGRDTFSLYNEDMREGVSAVNTIDGNAMLESKGFEKNITEYVFRIMYDADDKTEAIQSVLELLAKHYNLSRVSVFEKSEDSKYVKCTFEWATDSLATQRGNLQMLALDDGHLYQDNFDKDGILFLPDITM
ncbi:MAG: diguanylate cyclase, partial [Oscillospiraceae bacterium]